MSRNLEKALAALDVGTQTSDEHGYPEDHGLAASDVCVRCGSAPDDGDLCAGCRAFLLEDSDVDPAADGRYRPWSRLDGGTLSIGTWWTPEEEPEEVLRVEPDGRITGRAGTWHDDEHGPRRVVAGGDFDRAPLWADREGNPIGLDRWAELIADDDYRIVRQDTVVQPDGTEVRVSTCWFGILGVLPNLFETMAWSTVEARTVLLERITSALDVPARVVAGLRDLERERLQVRWPTEDAARRGHAAACALFTSGRTAGGLGYGDGREDLVVRDLADDTFPRHHMWTTVGSPDELRPFGVIDSRSDDLVGWHVIGFRTDWPLTEQAFGGWQITDYPDTQEDTNR